MGGVAQLVGESLAEELKEKSLAIYSFAEEYARSRGIIIADTKFEFGLLDNQVILIDELLTPDSSRFWDASDYQVGRPQPAFDKQMVRDWLTSSGWNKEPPAPTLPDDLIQRTAERYREAYRRLTGVTIQH
jgi:phosphoribosylaminoimidazole-succinocarboxamide synthase